jgi:uncharacterized protein YbcC (UPF0753/DUF2309 family)
VPSAATRIDWLIDNKKNFILAEHLKKAHYVHVVENKVTYLMKFNEPQKEVYLYTFKK